MESFEDMLKRHEGNRATPYIDSVGVQTIGYGHNLHKPLSERARQVIFEDDLADAKNDCLHAFPWFADLDEPRQWVLVNMCFNMGLTRLQGFYKFLNAVQSGDYQTAAIEMLDSLWARQVKRRATELAAIMQGSVTV